LNNLLLFEHEIHSENQYLIESPERFQHIIQVLDKTAGDELNICEVNKSLGKARIDKLTNDSVTLTVLSREMGVSFDIKLFVAISRPPTMKKILEHGTSLGVSEFHFYRPELTEKSYLDAKLFKEKLFTTQIELGLSQSKVFWKLPKVILHQELPILDNIELGQKYLLKMQAKKKFSDFPPDLKKPISLVIGPERGLIPSENLFFEESGFTPIEVSPSTLRVEIATFAALSQLFLF